MFWNTKRVTAAEVPDDLWEFTKPKWKNRTASGNPALAGFALNWYSWVCECRKQHPAGERPPSGLGVKWMNVMRENGILMPGQIGPLTQSIASGQRDIGVHSSRRDLHTQKHFPLKKGTVSFDQLWLLDLESVTPEETKKFIKLATEALAGQVVK